MSKLPVPAPFHWVKTGLSGLAGLTMAATSALAQGNAQIVPAPVQTFPISGFELTGDIPISSEDTSRVLASFIGPKGTIETLQQATAALEAELKAKGFGLHRVSLPPQEVGKKVTLTIVKFTIGKVTVEGNQNFGQDNIRSSIPEISENSAPNFKRLAVQTTLANESQAKQVQISLKESEEADKIDVKVLVKDSSPWTASSSFSNTGSDATGKDRISFVLGHVNLLDRDHQINAAFTTSPGRTSDVKQFGLSYRVPLYAAGGVVSASLTKSDVEGNFGSFSSSGAGRTAGVSYAHYFAPQGGTRSWLTFGLEDRLFNASRINGVVSPGQVDRLTRPISVGYTHRNESDILAWGYNAEFVANLGGGNGNSLPDYKSEDPRIATSQWKLLRGGANLYSLIGAGWALSARSQFQVTTEPLISGEQFGLGGSSSIRGTGERVISGDRGISMTAEISTPELMAGLRAIGFVDGGWIGNLNSNLNPNKPERDQLTSYGLGLRYGRSSVSASAEWARLTNGATPVPSSPTNAPKAGDSKLHVNLSIRF